MERLIEYVGKREDGFQVLGKGTKRLYAVDAPGQVIRVDLADYASFPRQFFRPVEPPRPEEIRTGAEPLDRPALIDPADGISDEEAVAADRALRSYRKQKLGEKMDRIMAVDSDDPEDYYDAAKDG